MDSPCGPHEGGQGAPGAPRPAGSQDRPGASPRGFVFAGGKEGAPLSNMAMLELLRRMGRDDLTVHGFRSDLPGLGGGMHRLSGRGL